MKIMLSELFADVIDVDCVNMGLAYYWETRRWC